MPSVQEASPSRSLKPRKRLLLYHPEDDEYLTRLVCLVRRQLEVYPIQITGPAGGDVCSGNDAEPRRAGIRCIHCAPPEPVPGAPPSNPGDAFHRRQRAGATSLPTSTRLVYQSVRNWQRKHFLACPEIPPEVKANFQELKRMKNGGGIASSGPGARRGRQDSAPYWEKSCRRMGLVDTDIGLCLRWEVLNGTWTEEMAKEAMGPGLTQIETVNSMFTSSVPLQVSGEEKRNVTKVESEAAMSPEEKRSVTKVESEAAMSAVEKARRSFDLTASFIAGRNGDASSASPPINQQKGVSGSFRKQRPVSDCDIPKPGGISWGTESGFQTVMPAMPPHPEYFAVETRPESLKSFSAERPPNSDINAKESSRVSESSTSLLNERLLAKMKMALGAVQALGEMREFAPSMPPPLNETNFHDEDNGGDAKDDLAFLGMELYELFAGQPPCIQGRAVRNDSDEDNEYAAHQRQKRDKRSSKQKFVPLREFGIPSSLCDLVTSLLECKETSAPVYKSVAEVEEDLLLISNRPQKYLFNKNTLNREFQIPQHPLYGREEEIEKLLHAFDWTTNPAAPTNGMVLISGYAGTGKSCLVAAVRDRLVERGACFASGKFDAMRQMRPLSAVVSAFDDFCALLACDEDRSEKVRDAISAAVGAEGRVLADMIPNLRKVMRLPDAFASSSSHVGGREAMQRLMFLFRMLLRATCSRTHPVVLFLDDLQWADEVSLELVHALVTDVQLSGLLFVGSYRDNEVAPDNPLSTWLGIVRDSGRVNVRSVAVGNLDGSSVNSFVSDTLCMLPRMTRDLSGAVLHKTGGNALFVAQFLSSLRDEGLLSFSLTTRQWHWDIEKITSKDIADNVVELMTEKILSLAPEVRSALRVAAGFGAQCHQDILQIVDRESKDIASTNIALDVAVSEGLVMKVGASYRFSHDQIQRAAYLLIPESEREAFHLQLGRSLWGSCSADELESHLFVVVDQLHRGSALLNNHDEKVNLAQLNLMAGQKASSVSAFLPASAYFKAGIQLMADNDWEMHRELCFDLYNSCAEMEHILGDFDGMKQHLDEVLKRARTLDETLRPNFSLVQSLGAQQGHVVDAINTGLSVLFHLGEAFPAVVTKLTVQQELIATNELLCNKSEEDISKLDPMHDAGKREAMKFLNRMIYYAYTEKKEYFPVIACRMVRLSLQHGVCGESAMGFCSYGMLLCGPIGDYAGGFRFGQIGLRLMKRFHVRELLAKIYVVVFAMINPWKDPIQASLPCLKEAVSVGLATGDTESAMLAAHSYGGMAFCSGKALGPLVEEMSQYAKQMVECKQHHIYAINRPSRQAALYLLGSASDMNKSDTNDLGDGSLFDDVEGDGASAYSSALQLLYRMWIQYLFAEYENAVNTAKILHEATGAKKSGVLPRVPQITNGTLYSCLAAIALARKRGTFENSDTIQESMAQMKIWASSAPWNHESKLQLMNAEYAFLEGDLVAAAQAYDVSIQLAKNRSLINEQALALERAGIFFLESGEYDVSANYFMRSRDCYTQWGAHRKAAHIQAQYL